MGNNISNDGKTHVDTTSIGKNNNRENALEAELLTEAAKKPWEMENYPKASLEVRIWAIEEYIKRQDALEAARIWEKEEQFKREDAKAAELTLGKMRVKWSLKKAPPSLNKSKRIPYDHMRFSINSMNFPTILVGPKGCGRSTLLLSATHDYYKSGDGSVKFITIGPYGKGLSGRSNLDNRGRSNGTISAQDIFDDFLFDSYFFGRATESFLGEINYPIRPPLGYIFWHSLRSIILRTGANPMLRTKIQNTTNRELLLSGLSLLIECADELGRKSGKPTLLAFDEFYDLIRMDGLGLICGSSLLNLLATQAIKYGLNSQTVSQTVRFVFTSESETLGNSFNKTVLKSTRRCSIRIEDYSQHELVEFLFSEYGIPRENSTRYTDVVGCRFHFMRSIHWLNDTVEEHIESLLSRYHNIAYPLMRHPACAKLMFAICEGEEVLVRNVPKEVLEMFHFSDVFYIDDLGLKFQNDMVKHVWVTKYQEKHRENLLKRA